MALTLNLKADLERTLTQPEMEENLTKLRDAVNLLVAAQPGVAQTVTADGTHINIEDVDQLSAGPYEILVIWKDDKTFRYTDLAGVITLNASAGAGATVNIVYRKTVALT
jgi:hypothetical protein